MDQHILAEYRELPMVVGSLRVNDWKIKSPVPDVFNLGKGHINFFKIRLAYLRRRHEAVKEEMKNRGFKCDALEIVQNCPSEFWNDWNPTLIDSSKIRNRIFEKITKNKLPISWWRYKGINLNSQYVNEYLNLIMDSELFPA